MSGRVVESSSSMSSSSKRAIVSSSPPPSMRRTTSPRVFAGMRSGCRRSRARCAGSSNRPRVARSHWQHRARSWGLGAVHRHARIIGGAAGSLCEITQGVGALVQHVVTPRRSVTIVRTGRPPRACSARAGLLPSWQSLPWGFKARTPVRPKRPRRWQTLRCRACAETIAHPGRAERRTI